MASPLSTSTTTFLIALLFVILMVLLSPVTAQDAKKPDIKALIDKFLKAASAKKEP